MRSVGLDPALEMGGGGSRSLAAQTQTVMGAVVTDVQLAGPHGWRAVAKRSIDIVGSLLLLLLVLPVLLVVTVAVKLGSSGPVLYRQTRLGHRGEPFTMLKFRTFPNDHRPPEAIRAADDLVIVPGDESPLPLGRLLRRTSIDELPQLINVLAGHMSLVGPRPERPELAAELAARVPGYEGRHRVPAGLTGRAQVLGFMGDTCIVRRIEADNEYVEQWSLARDLGILVRTVPAVLRKTRI